MAFLRIKGISDFLSSHPRTCVTLGFLVLFASNFFRAACPYEPAGDLTAIERMILFNGWDDGYSFYQIMIKGYRSLPLTEYREMPLYPLFARVFALFTGPVYALMVVSFLSSFLSCHVMFLLLERMGMRSIHALGGTFFFMALRTPESLLGLLPHHLPPMEMLVAIQGSEPLFLVFVLLSYYFMIQDKHLAAAILLALSTLVRLPGCFIAFGAFVYLLAKRDLRAFLYIFSPVVLLCVFFYFYLISGDFFAFFHASQAFYPEGVFTWPYKDLIKMTGNISQDHLCIIYYIFFHGFFLIGLLFLWKRERRLFWLTFPSYIVAISLRGWSHHMRYYIILWGVNWSWYQAIWGSDPTISSKNY